jgi:alpha-1,4-digalacturonate transport system substrate-binding protein
MRRLTCKEPFEMSFPTMTRTCVLAASAAVLIATPALAQELRVQCYSDGNECEVTGDIAKRFEAANAGARS